MCGIIGYVGDGSTTDMILGGLKRLEYRGYDSAGLAVAHGDQLEVVRSQGKLINLSRQLDSNKTNGTYGLGHTRWATHGAPTEANAHPHRDCTGSIVVVHNGIVENYLELKARLISDGHNLTTDTDTEIIVHTLEKHFKGDLATAVRASMDELKGVFTFVAMSTHNPDLLVGARNGPPLVLGIGEEEAFIASDIPAFLSQTRTAVFLEDGDIAIVRRGEVEITDRAGAAQERAPERINWDPVQAEKQGFKHYMLKEIYEQPKAVRDSLANGKVAEVSDALLTGKSRVSILACGTSWLAAQVGKFLIEELARLPVEVDVASEFRYRNPIVKSDHLVIGITQSGETADTLAALKLAKQRGAKTLAICNVTGSMVTRVCDETLYTQAGPEIGVAATKTFTSQLVALYRLALRIGLHQGTLSPVESDECLTQLALVPFLMDQVLSLSPAIEAIAREFYLANNFLFLGRGPQFPIALEGALKLKELSYIHAEGYPAGEMKHGPIALIDDRMPVVAIALDDPLFDKIASNIQEAKARGARIVALVTEGDSRLPQVLDEQRDCYIELPKHPSLVSPLLTAIPLQLLAYHISVRRGTDVDQPRNLAKSVTVE